jgi:hypothetical protein
MSTRCRGNAARRRSTGLVADWVAAHSFDQVMKVFLAEGGRGRPGLRRRPVARRRALPGPRHVRCVDDPDLGTATVQAPVAVLSETPGAVQHLGRGLGADNDSVYGGLLGLDAARMDRNCARRARYDEPALAPFGVGTPASNEHMCEAAAGAGPVPIWCFLDLEDACAPSAKESARPLRSARNRAGLGPHRKGRARQRNRHTLVPRTTSRHRHRCA